MKDVMVIDEASILTEANFAGWLDCFTESSATPTKKQLADKIENQVLSRRNVEKAFNNCDDKKKEAKARGWLRTMCSRIASLILDDPATFLSAAILATIVGVFAVCMVKILVNAGTLIANGLPVNSYSMSLMDIFGDFLFGTSTLMGLLKVIAAGASVYAAVQWLLKNSKSSAAAKGRQWLAKRKKEGEGGIVDTARAGLMLYPKD